MKTSREILEIGIEESREEEETMQYSEFFRQQWYSEEELREIIRAVIWRIGMDEGGQVLHYNDWVDDNWKELLNTPTDVGENKLNGGSYQNGNE